MRAAVPTCQPVDVAPPVDRFSGRPVMSITIAMGGEDRQLASDTDEVAPVADVAAACPLDWRRCAIAGCDGEEHGRPKFGRVAVALPGGDRLQIPLCPGHYDAIVEANGRRNAWMADAERWQPDGD